MSDTKGKHRELMDQLKLKSLQLLMNRMEDGTITAAELAAFFKLAEQHGWDELDPAQAVDALKRQLTAEVDPKLLSEDDPDVPEGLEVN